MIEAFVEAAHAPSFRTAAARCSISPAAFSRRIQAFTVFVGHDVFERHAGGIRLTEAGRDCLARLEPTLISMKQAALDIGAATISGRVTVSLSHSLAVGWLIPRLNRFRELCPDIDVGIQMVRTSEAIRQGEADCGICATDIDVVGLHAEHLFDVRVAPVACRDIAKQFKNDPASLSQHPLLGMRRHPDLWPWWIKESGAEIGLLSTRPNFDIIHATYEAAAEGLGIAVGMDVTIGPHFTSGRLVDLGLPWLPYPAGYRLVTTSSRMRSQPVKRFWSWLIEEKRSFQDAPIAQAA